MTSRRDRSPFASKLAAFANDSRGAVYIWVAGGMFVFIGMAALAVDMSFAYVLRNNLQTAADSAALAAVSQLPDETAGRVEAKVYAANNMSTEIHGAILKDEDLKFGNWDSATRTITPGVNPVNAANVTLRRAEANANAAPAFFGQIFGSRGMDIVVSATATPGGPTPCLLSLDPDEPDAGKVNNGSVITENCSLHVNSSDTGALDVASGGVVDAEEICVHGGADVQGSTSVEPETGCNRIADPLAGMTPPLAGPCKSGASYGTGKHTLSPGTFCGGIHISGDAQIELEPGTYIIQDGAFKLTGGDATVVGEGVTLYFTGSGAVLDVSGQGGADLSAPVSGDYAGILFYGDPNAPPNTKHGISGGGNMVYEGTMYFPTAELNITGNGTGSTEASYTMAIARLLKFSGNGSLQFNFSPDGSVPLPAGLKARQSARLVQ
jgi:Flp pilus assembly protein TadG